MRASTQIELMRNYDDGGSGVGGGGAGGAKLKLVPLYLGLERGGRG